MREVLDFIIGDGARRSFHTAQHALSHHFMSEDTGIDGGKGLCSANTLFASVQPCNITMLISIPS